ncbi:MAG: zf-HC2 domain-containing protein, partial [Chloroflexi bacterium]|nr:zf-HC2 domain-containing protein [Chloroflexota bacterium]
MVNRMRWLHGLFGRDGDASASATPEQLRDERLSAYLDGELAAADAAALERELGEDTALRTEFELLRDVRSALRT